MDETNRDMHAVLYLVVCAAPPAQQIHDFVLLAQAAHWDVCVIATPQATQFIDRKGISTRATAVT